MTEEEELVQDIENCFYKSFNHANGKEEVVGVNLQQLKDILLKIFLECLKESKK